MDFMSTSDETTRSRSLLVRGATLANLSTLTFGIRPRVRRRMPMLTSFPCVESMQMDPKTVIWGH